MLLPGRKKDPRVCSVGYTGARGILVVVITKLAQLSGTGTVLKSYRTYRGVGIQFPPNHAGVFGRVLRPKRTLPECPVGC